MSYIIYATNLVICYTRLHLGSHKQYRPALKPDIHYTRA